MLTNFALLDFGTPELILILLIVLVLFGSKKLPELSRGIGESVKELRKAASSTDDLRKEVKTQATEVKASFSGDSENHA